MTGPVTEAGTVAATDPATGPTSGEPARRGPHIARRWWALGRLLLPALAGGGGLALSLPPWGLWFLAGPAAGIVWWRLGGLPVGQRILVGWVAGLGLFVTGLWWALTFNVYGGVVLMVLQALALALACAATPPGRGRGAALVGAMVLVEALRSGWPFGGLPLGGIALGQAGGALAGAARLGGPLLLVGLVWLLGVGLGQLVTALAFARRGRSGTAARASGGRGGAGVAPRVLAASAALGAVAALGLWGALGPDGGAGTATVRVAAVQGGGARGLHKAEVTPAEVLAAQLSASDRIPAADGGRRPALVVWPEDVVALQVPLSQSPAESVLAATARRLGTTLAVGVTEDVSATHFRNEIVAFAPDGDVVARFEKVHRVPFGEYVPDRGFFSHLANLSGVPLDAIAGHGDGVLHTPAGALGTMVSYEVFFADRGRIATRAGARLLIVPTNTASYATSQVPTQEIAAARLQAIAEGRDLVQASPTGFSALIDNHGRVLARSVLGRRQVVVGDVRLRSGLTVYGRAGDLPVLVAAAVLVVGGWMAALTAAGSARPVRRRRRRRPDTDTDETSGTGTGEP